VYRNGKVYRRKVSRASFDDMLRRFDFTSLCVSVCIIYGYIYVCIYVCLCVYVCVCICAFRYTSVTFRSVKRRMMGKSPLFRRVYITVTILNGDTRELKWE